MVKSLLASWNEADMAAVRDLHDPEVTMRPVRDWPEQGPYVGQAAVMRFLEQLRDTWDFDTLEAVTVTPVGERVLLRFVWHGAGHGPEAEVEMTDVLTIRDGRICGHDFFWTHAEALEAAGLSE